MSDCAQSELGLTGCAANFSRFSQRADYIYVHASETDLICVSVVGLKQKRKNFLDCYVEVVPWIVGRLKYSSRQNKNLEITLKR